MRAMQKHGSFRTTVTAGGRGCRFNEKKAYECYLRGASAGSARAVLGALRAGQYDEQMKQSARYSIEESYRQVRDAAEMGDVYAAWQIGRGS